MKTLTSVEQKFILHWGEMGSQWGINRTVAQIHALLMISEPPQNAEDIVEKLGVARSNVSSSIKELLGWGIIKRVHVLGDSRDHFDSNMAMWEMFRVVLNERKRREVDPTTVLLRECIEEAGKDKATDKYAMQRLRELEDFFRITTTWYEQINKKPTSMLVKFFTAGDKLFKLLGLS